MIFAAEAEKPDCLLPIERQTGLRILVVTAVSVERDAVERGLQGDPRFEVLVGGVGSVAAAVNTAKALMTADYNLVISAGIGGGFPGKAEIGSLVVANEIIIADLGTETAEGFCSIEELGFGFTHVQTDDSLVDIITRAFSKAKLVVNCGQVLTVSTVTGTLQRGIELEARFPRASAEAMEGYGVGVAAYDRGLPVLEIRAISNMVGPRDRSSWRIHEALAALEAAGSVLREVLV